MIPRWKIAREMSRLKAQLRAIPEAIFEPFSNRRYDASFPKQLKQAEGSVAMEPQVALLLIYPVPALAESTLFLLESLVRAGFAPLVVCNAPLSETDVERLKHIVWRLVIRPNVGHDFGGYRDGIRLLDHLGVDPEELLVLNDSVWLLDGDAAPLIARLRASGGDVAGAVLRERGSERFLESYCYLLGRSALRSQGYKTYWTHLGLTSNKAKVIRRGERGHSAALIADGLRLTSISSRENFLTALAAASDTSLRDIISFGAYLYDFHKSESQSLVQAIGRPGWRDDVMDFILRVARKGQFYSLFPVASRGLIDHPFLKRSGVRVSVLWRAAFHDAVNAGVLAKPHPVIWTEIKERVAADRATNKR